MDIVETIGAYAGVIAFLGMALLILLYFSMGRDLRRLREWAGRAPERSAGVQDKFSEDAAKKASPKSAKFRFPRQPKYIALLVGGIVVLGAAASFAAIQISGDGTQTESTKKEKKKKSSAAKVSSVQPSQVTVAVLNGTSTPGLAATIGSSLKAVGFKVGNVTNASESSVVTTRVLYKKGNSAEAKAVAKQLKVPSRRIAKIDRANASLSGGANVAVIVGTDRADEAPTPEQSQSTPSTGQATPDGTVQPQ